MLAFPWDLNPSKPQGVDNLRRGLSFSGHPFFIPWVLTSKFLLLHASNDTRTWTVTVFKLRSERTFIDFSLKCKWELEDWCVVTEDPQLQLGNPDRTQMLQCFMLLCQHKRSLVVSAVFTKWCYLLCFHVTPSDPPMWADLPNRQKGPGARDILLHSELVKTMVPLLNFWLA